MTRKLLWLAVLFVFLLVLITGIWTLTAPTAIPPQSIKLANGDTLTLEDVSYGATNTVIIGKPYQKYLYRLLPAKFKGWTHCRVITYGSGGTGTNTPVFWIMKTSHEATTASSFFHVTPFDEYGCELKNSSSRMTGNTISDHDWLSSYEFEPQPPHGKLIGLNVYDSEAKTSRLGVFLIPGTVVKPAPPLPAEPLSEKEDGDLKFQLLSFLTGLKPAPFPSWYGTNFTNLAAFTQAAFQVIKAGQVVSNWQPYTLQITGPDSANLRPRYFASESRDGQGIFNFAGAFEPEKGPWKLRVEFTHETGFAPEELVEISSVPVPADFGTADAAQQVDFQNTTLRVEKSFGSGISPPTNLWSFTPPPPFLRVSMTPPNSSLHLRLTKAIDKSGSNQVANLFPGYFGGKYYFQLRGNTNAQTLDLTFALHRSRFIEFQANSTWYPTNSTTGK